MTGGYIFGWDVEVKTLAKGLLSHQACVSTPKSQVAAGMPAFNIEGWYQCRKRFWLSKIKAYASICQKQKTTQKKNWMVTYATLPGWNMRKLPPKSWRLFWNKRPIPKSWKRPTIQPQVIQPTIPWIYQPDSIPVAKWSVFLWEIQGKQKWKAPPSKKIATHPQAIPRSPIYERNPLIYSLLGKDFSGCVPVRCVETTLDTIWANYNISPTWIFLK